MAEDKDESQEKTQEPSSRKLEKARQEGKVVSSKETPIVSFLEYTDAAITVTNHSLSDFKKAVLKLEADKNLINTLGVNGRKIVKEKFNKQTVIQKYIKLAEDL